MSTTKTLTFYQRFELDILKGKKTITIRDAKAKNYKVGQTVQASTDHDNKVFAELQIRSIEPLIFDKINDNHAKQENMSLLELRNTIQEIYPEVHELYVIGFQVVG